MIKEKRIDQLELLNGLALRVEAHLSETLELFQNLDEKTLLKPSGSGGWSIAQCLEHLNTYGYHYLPLIGKGLEQHGKPSGATYFKSTWLGAYFTRLMEPGEGMKKMKTFKHHIPADALDVHAVIREFVNQQEELLRLLKMASGRDLNRIKIRISISRLVRLKLGDVFQFIIAHDERHLQQAKRNL
jgi:hypothetical protein